jgi:hypothetical protein
MRCYALWTLGTIACANHRLACEKVVVAVASFLQTEGVHARRYARVLKAIVTANPGFAAAGLRDAIAPLLQDGDF